MMSIVHARQVYLLACRAIIIALIVVTAVLPAGCDGGSSSTPVEDDRSVERIARRGPVTLTVRADPGEVSVGDTIALLVEAVTEPGVDVVMPAFEDTLGPFEIRQRRTPPDVPDAGKRRWTHEYELTTFDFGPLEIPAVAVQFTDRRAGRVDGGSDVEPVASELSAEPLPVMVNSVLAEDFDPTAFRDIRGPVEVPVERSALVIWGPIVGAVILAVVVLIALILIRRRGSKSVRGATVEPPAHVWARQKLDELAAMALLESGSVQEYYFRLSNVVREYIERRFALMAPERTTEEFLREAEGGTVLRTEHRRMLAGFLRAADMVKFALHRPPAAEGAEAMEAARSFVQETAGCEESPAANGADDHVEMEGAA